MKIFAPWCPKRISAALLDSVSIFGTGVREFGLHRVRGLSDTLRYGTGTFLQVCFQAVTQFPDPLVLETGLGKSAGHGRADRKAYGAEDQRLPFH